MIIAMAGLPATGKSVITRGLEVMMNALIIDKDIVRASLFETDDIEYSRKQDDFVMDIIFRLVKYLLLREPDRTIIIDGRPFSRRYQRETLYEAPDASHASLRLIECVCSEESARNRLNQAVLSEGHVARNRDFEMYLRHKNDWEIIERSHLVVDTDKNNEEDCIKMAYEFLLAN